MVPFVLRTEPTPWSIAFYAGKTYVHQYESYAVVVTSLDRAKQYKTKAGAEKAAKALDKKIWNYSFHVYETK